MTQFVRIGLTLVNLDHVALIKETSEFVDGGFLIEFIAGDGMHISDPQECAQLSRFVNQQQSLESLIVPEHVCHICEAKETTRCELCGEYACNKHTEFRIVVGYDELKNCCDTCYFN